ncbi:MAG: PQQ-binding-like beta-propeller repeat protein [Pirellulales bacterium]
MSADGDRTSEHVHPRDPGSLVFVGFNSRLAALDRETGELIWKWKAPTGSGIPAILLDGDRLIVSLQGYTYCLDPVSGGQIWYNPLKGLGVGTPCLATARANTTPQLYAVLAEYERQQRANDSIG